MTTTDPILRLLAPLVLAAVTLTATRARADDASERAEALFQEAKVLMDQGRYAQMKGVELWVAAAQRQSRPKSLGS